MIENDPWAKLDKPLINERNDFADRIDQLFVDKDQSVLDEEFRNKCKHPKSQNLPKNAIVEKAISLKATNKNTLKETNSDWDFSETSEEKEYKSLKNHFPETYEVACDRNKNPLMKDSLDVAQWKLHLNVGIDSINEVSKYLKESNFHHKLLSGGDIEDGKIFTIYIGSYKLTKELAKKYSQK